MISALLVAGVLFTGAPGARLRRSVAVRPYLGYSALGSLSKASAHKTTQPRGLLTA
jgi:hypothetical protein